MGSHSSKAAKGDVMAQDAAAAADASPSKANGQENGHVKINGDVSPKADGEATPLNGNGSAELVKEEAKLEAGSGDAIEPAPVTEGAEAKPADGATDAAAAPKETPKKKKKFSFKKSFKLSGISFRKTKKEAGDASAVSSPSEEQGKAEAKGEENLACAAGESEQEVATKEESPEEKPAAPVEPAVTAAAPEGQQEAESKREEVASEGPEEEEKQQQPPPSESQEDTKPGETSKPAEAEPSPAPAEQKEE
ncbi:MARCKS-related protein [Zootoca vivipara]|uniref:MARCKS-related protein n=1 Tax=Zootoca vivipara TaxID=8524 RepID=UPI00158FE478|nr:MARCKS-related protein [Zootoca vivipara]